MRVQVPVVDVGVVRVAVGEHLVPMRVRMEALAGPLEVVRMLVMLVMAMPVRVLERFVHVSVFVPFPDVQPDPDRHQRSRYPEQHRRRLRPERQ